jgi:hypothetical protein
MVDNFDALSECIFCSSQGRTHPKEQRFCSNTASWGKCCFPLKERFPILIEKNTGKEILLRLDEKLNMTLITAGNRSDTDEIDCGTFINLKTFDEESTVKVRPNHARFTISNHQISIEPCTQDSVININGERLGQGKTSVCSCDCITIGQLFFYLLF